MKDFYKISEISRLYGVGPDSLRYYERLGLLRPRRDEDNGYRLYSLRDIYKLSVIRDLRTLGLSMIQIKEYLDGQSVESTLALLEREEDLLSRQIHQLQARRETLARRRRRCPMPGRSGTGRSGSWSCRTGRGCPSASISPGTRRWTLSSSASTSATRSGSRTSGTCPWVPSSPWRTWPGG